MFFRKKEKEEVPVIGGHKQRPPVPPKRTILPNANNKTNQTESNHKLESTDEHASIYDTPKPPKFTIAGGDSDEASTARGGWTCSSANPFPFLLSFLLLFE
ncbi:hypothetical protein Y032_0138g2053 [Ancylostoma ceylanicum]|nr:hypothetical protein Y032_0138g2053 [Ancylostoma ceylanicum]